MSSEKSSHILNTSSNLLGFCLVVLTSLKISKFNELSFIDELTGVASVMLIIASLISFLSIRSNNEKQIREYERIADLVFIVALLLIFMITFLIAFTVIF